MISLDLNKTTGAQRSFLRSRFTYAACFFNISK